MNGDLSSDGGQAPAHQRAIPTFADYVLLSAHVSLEGKRMLRHIQLAVATAAVLGLVPAVAAPAPAASSRSQLLSVGKPATSTGSDAPSANDADASTSWQSPLIGGRRAWWQVDLQHVSRVTKIAIYSEPGDSYRYFVRTSLDGVHWSTPIIRKAGDSPAQPEGESYDVDAVGRFVRVDVTASSGGSVRVREVEVYGHTAEQGLTSPLAVSVTTDRGAVDPGTPINARYIVRNTTAKEVTARVQSTIAGLTDPYFQAPTNLDETIKLGPHARRQLKALPLWTAGTVPGAYGVYTRVTLSTGERWEEYNTFFRVLRPNDLTSFRIDRATYRGYPVYELDGGLSAELLVSTSANALNASVGSAWKPFAAGQGTRAVVATPDFLERAIESTVAAYDELLGKHARFENAVIGTGVLNTHYMGSTLKAPVLPSQFLVSVDSYKELETVLDRANAAGLKSYATLGYDYSLEMPGVAWVKLLDAPTAYRAFLRRHKVQRVLLSGTTRPGGGEVRAKQVLRDGGVPTQGYRPGDIFLMFPGTSESDVSAQYRAIVDVGDAVLEPEFRDVSDWESGLADEQVEGIAAGVRHQTLVGEVGLFTSDDTGALYTAAAYASLAYMKKNSGALAPDGGPLLRGVALDPYDNPRPFYELVTGQVPLPFWQGSGDFWVWWNIDQRFNTILRDAVSRYFPDADFDSLVVRLNVSRNFGATPVADTYGRRLRELGFTTVVGDTSVDDVWDLSDGINSLGERAVEELADGGDHTERAELLAKLRPLSFSDLAEVAEAIHRWFPSVEFRTLP